MADQSVSEFSRALADLLQGFMRERGITTRAVAERLGRSAGFVSERTSGKRPADTDVLDAVADLAHMETRDLVLELARRMLDLPPQSPRGETTRRSG